jgi:hypothetical protein
VSHPGLQRRRIDSRTTSEPNEDGRENVAAAGRRILGPVYPAAERGRVEVLSDRAAKHQVVRLCEPPAIGEPSKLGGRRRMRAALAGGLRDFGDVTSPPVHDAATATAERSKNRDRPTASS